MWLTRVVAEEIDDISKLHFRLCYLLATVPLGIHSASPFPNRNLSLGYLYRQNSMINPFTKLPNVHIPSRHYELSEGQRDKQYMVSMKIINNIDRISLQFETWVFAWVEWGKFKNQRMHDLKRRRQWHMLHFPNSVIISGGRETSEEAPGPGFPRLMFQSRRRETFDVLLGPGRGAALF